MLIGGAANGSSIELSYPEGLSKPAGTETYCVTLRANDFEVSTRVYAFTPDGQGLQSFFAELAEQWRGWEGTMAWSSLEGEFTLECQHDRIGHVLTTATLHSSTMPDGWTGQVRFVIAASELDSIAAGLAHFFSQRRNG